MKIAIIGGHLAPALAVIDALPIDTEIVFIGRKYVFEADKTISLEYQTITDRKIPFEILNTGRLQRKITKYTVLSLLKLPIGLPQAIRILTRHKPDIVLGFGGYLSVPVITAAYLMQIPSVIHEQTLGAGLANKLIAVFARKICISWESSRKFFPAAKTILTGNPVRKEIIEAEKREKEEHGENVLPTIYITGGSSGSHAINMLLLGSAEKLLQKYHLVHQTGDAQKFQDFQKLEELKNTLPEKMRADYTIRKFIAPSEVAERIANADLVISRSGINTVTELLYLKKPALLIPLPFSQNNEQLENANFLRKVGLAEVYIQSSLTQDIFTDVVERMMQERKQYTIKEELALHRDATEKIIEVILHVAKEKKSKTS